MRRLFQGCVLLASFAASERMASADMIHPTTVFTLRADSEGASATGLYPYFNGVGWSGLVTQNGTDQIDRTYMEFSLSSIKQPFTSASLQFFMGSPQDTTINVGAYKGTGKPNLGVWNVSLTPIATFHALDPPMPPGPPPGGVAESPVAPNPGGPTGPGFPDFSNPNYSLDITQALKSFTSDNSAFIGFAFSIPNDSIGNQVMILSEFTPDISLETLNATPEPASIFLAATGVVGVIGFGLRRKGRHRTIL